MAESCMLLLLHGRAIWPLPCHFACMKPEASLIFVSGMFSQEGSMR